MPSSIAPGAGAIAPQAPPPRRVHAEHHANVLQSALRTTFALDIPSDASPGFGVTVNGVGPTASEDGGGTPGGLEWKVRLCLLVVVAPSPRQGGDQPEKAERPSTRQLVRDGPAGEWGAAYRATAGVAPLSRTPHASAASQAAGKQQGWAAWAASLLAPSDTGGGAYHDGDEFVDSGHGDLDGLDEVDGGIEGWRELVVERVECEVPVKVWPGNTAFKAAEVVFDV